MRRFSLGSLLEKLDYRGLEKIFARSSVPDESAAVCSILGLPRPAWSEGYAGRRGREGESCVQWIGR